MKNILAALFVISGFIVACEKDDGNTEDKSITIDGEVFSPATNTVVKTSAGYVLTFTEEAREVIITTNDSIDGTYQVTEDALKHSSSLLATIIYSNGTDTFAAINGSVVITNNSSGSVSGTYEATLASATDTIDLAEGSFSGLPVENEPLPVLTEAVITDTLIYCYGAFNSFIETEYLFDAVYANKTSSPSTLWDEVYNHSLTPSNSQVKALWEEGMSVIFLTNFIATNASTVITDESVCNEVIAQAKAIRAYVNLSLVNWFGDIPLETGTEAGLIARSPDDEVLSQVITELLEAQSVLPQQWSSSEDAFRITSYFIQGLLSRIYLFQQNYTLASSSAQQIINSGLYTLNTDTANFTSTNDYEIIWGFEEGENTEFNTFFEKGSYIPAIRLTEIFLIFGESSFKIGNTMSALESINQLRARLGQANLETITENDILQQWYVEMHSEGTIFQLMKWSGSAESELQLDNYRLLLPVPTSVLESNPQITQNPGY